MRKNKTITLYNLELHLDGYPPKILTTASCKKDLEEYMHLWLRENLLEEYRDWAEEVGLDWEAWTTWKFFYKLEIPWDVKSTLKIRKIKYKFGNILAILRMFGCCEPLGCSYELPIENEYFESMLEELKNQDDTNSSEDQIKIKETTSKEDNSDEG